MCKYQHSNTINTHTKKKKKDNRTPAKTTNLTAMASSQRELNETPENSKK